MEVPQPGPSAVLYPRIPMWKSDQFGALQSAPVFQQCVKQKSFLNLIEGKKFNLCSQKDHLRYPNRVRVLINLCQQEVKHTVLHLDSEVLHYLDLEKADKIMSVSWV